MKKEKSKRIISIHHIYMKLRERNMENEMDNNISLVRY